MKEIKFDKKEIDYLIDCIELNCIKTYPPPKEEVSILKKLKNANKQIKPSSAKAKGRNFQYYVCEKLAEKFGIEYNQSDDNCLIHSREMGQHGKDIILRGDVYNKFPFDIECKNQEKISLSDWIEQAQSNTDDNRDWLLILKNKKIKKAVVCMDFEKFLILV